MLFRVFMNKHFRRWSGSRIRLCNKSKHCVALRSAGATGLGFRIGFRLYVFRIFRVTDF